MTLNIVQNAEGGCRKAARKAPGERCNARVIEFGIKYAELKKALIACDER